MKVQIDLDHEILDQCGVTAEQLATAVQNAVRKMEHPETGDPIFLNVDPRVIVIADLPEFSCA